MGVFTSSATWVSVCLWVVWPVQLSWAQTSTGAVSGTVLDQSGAVIPNAPVALTNTSTNVSRRTVTNEVGRYVYPAVVPGPYRLKIEAGGMQTFEASLTVPVQQSVVVDAILRPAQTTTAVEVRAVNPLITVDNPTLGHVLERQRIEQLPINGRSVESLLQTVPGMEGLRAYGQRLGSHEMVLDGSALEDRVLGGNLKRLPGLDTIQEFKVEVNNSSAKFTRPTTVILSTKSGTNTFHGAAFETHRNNALGKARRRTDFYDKPPQLIRNEFGASSGGPFLVPGLYDGRNRTFWFFAYEAQRNVNATTQGFTVPTEAMRRGDFRGLVDSSGRLTRIYDPWTTDPVTWQRRPLAYAGQENVIDPALLNPVTKYLFSLTPLPTHPNVNPLIDSNWWGPVRSALREWTLSARFDHRFSEKDNFSARLTVGDRFNSYPEGGYLPTPGGEANLNKQTAPNKSLALTWFHSFSPAFFNELLVSGSREHWRIAPYDESRFADQLGLPNPFDVPNFPRLTSNGLSTWRFLSANTRTAANNYLMVDDNATKIAGRHEFQFGVHLRHDQVNMLPDQQQISGTNSPLAPATALYDPSTSRTNPLAVPFTGSALASLYLGVVNYSNRLVRGYFYGRVNEYALYFQDNYKLTPRLTLNLGVRWEYWPAYREKNNILSSFDPERRAVVLASDLEHFYRLGATFPSVVRKIESFGGKFISYKEAGLSRNLMPGNPTNFGPRLGFAYRAGEGARSFVIRGGYRMAYFPIPLRIWTELSHFSIPLSAVFQNNVDDATQSPDGIPRYTLRSVPTVFAGVNSRDMINVTDAPALTRGSSMRVAYPHPDQPDTRTQDWNLTVEKDVTPDMVARAAYLGNHTRGLEQWNRYNDRTPTYIWYATTGLPLPTGEFSDVALRPYDQQLYGNIEEYRKSGWSNFNGVQLELERRHSRGYGFQVFYVMGNALAAGGLGWDGLIAATNQFLPGAVPAGLDERNRFLNYRRDTTVPKHRVRWNWIVDLPFGRGKPLGRNAGGVLERLIGGWQVAGLGSLRSNYFALPTDIYPTSDKIEIYGYQYPIQDCRGGSCWPGYLWWNGYIPAHQINSVDANGRPNGVMGVPDNYRPAAQPLNPWPKNPNRNDPMYPYYGSNTVF
ncbi:MAG: TonB-dependent receptor, partial [Acidobacteriota bacterium]